MVGSKDSKNSAWINKSEHIGPEDTGDNIAAKKVALYVDDGNFNGNWVRMTQPGGSGGGGTQYTDGSTTVTHPVGTIPVFDDSGTIVAVSTANPLPVDATFSGTVTSAPTFKDDPTDALETPKFGKTNSTTHKQQVEADTGLVQPTTPSDTQPVSATSLPLPTGAATAANQSTSNTSLANIDTNTSKDGSAFTFYSEALTDSASITPSSGKSIVIHKVLITNSANNSTFRNVTLSSTSLGTFLQGESVASSWIITLAQDEDLTITVSGTGTEYVNIQYKQV